MRVATVTAAEMKAVEDEALLRGVTPEMMIENAGRAVGAALVRQKTDLRDARVVVVAGPGQNGGAGLAAVRHLMVAGAEVEVVLARPLVQLLGLSRTYAELARNLDVVFWRSDSKRVPHVLAAADFVVDALLGCGQLGPLHGAVAELAVAIREHARSVVALDLPTGMDADTGRCGEGAVQAGVTVTLALPKTGFHARGAKQWTGTVLIASLGIPEKVLQGAGLTGPFPRFAADGLAPW